MIRLYIIQFFNYFIYFNPIELLLVLVLSLVILYKILRIKIVCKDLRIHNKFFNYGCVTLYIITCILVLIIIRWLHYNCILDVTSIANSCLNFIAIHSYLQILVAVLLIINIIFLWFIVFIKIHALLVIELLKFHLYHYYYYIKVLGPFKNTVIISTLYCKVIDNFYLGMFRSINKYFLYLRSFSNFLNRLYKKYPFSIFKGISKIFSIRNAFAVFRYTFFFILIFLVMYDCILNIWVLTKVYIYLPVYFLFVLWYKLTCFLFKTDDVSNKIIFQHYYCYPKHHYRKQYNKEYMQNMCMDKFIVLNHVYYLID